MPAMRRCGDPTSQLPQGNAALRCSSAFDLDLDLRRPVKPRWPQAGIAQWAPRQDAGVAATRPWMADRGGPTEQCMTAGMPSLGEAPSGGAKALWLLSRSSKVTRRQGGTLSRHDRSNGYVHTPRTIKELYRYSCRDSAGSVRDLSTAIAGKPAHIVYRYGNGSRERNSMPCAGTRACHFTTPWASTRY